MKSSKFSDEILIWQGLATAIAESVIDSTEPIEAARHRWHERSE
ncbi:MAG: hypothetical protein AAF283_05690 [Cyanobacteria bacterium P01_A01_bin.70]